MSLKYKPNDHAAAFAEAFFIANLLFVGVFYLALWVLYFFRYKQASSITKNHIKQALVASSFSTFIFIDINIIILLTSGYASLTALILLETYFMLFVPIFLVIGIFAFSRAVTGKDFRYPIIARILNLVDEAMQEDKGKPPLQKETFARKI